MPELYCIITDKDSVSFVERKAWSAAGNTEAETELLKGYEIVDSLVTTGGVYLILIDMDPNKYLDPDEVLWKIARITTNEETGKIELHSMEVTKAQARQFLRRGTWETLSDDM